MLGRFAPRLLAGRPAGRPWVERLPASVLIADIAGFTARAEELARLGPEGAEKLSGLLDASFERLFACFDRWGGQVVKIAGDAPIVVFLGPSSESAPRAAACALEVACLDCDGLRLRVGLGTGETFLAGVGGRAGHWELMLAGAPLEQAARAEGAARPGEAHAAEAVWPYLVGFDRQEGRLVGAPPIDPVPVERGPVDEESLRPYVCPAALARAGAELRPISVLFLRLHPLDYAGPGVLERLQEAVLVAQEVLAREEGSLLQCLMDDKGTVLVAAFGVPLSHHDDPLRAVRAALALERLGSVGVTTGRVFCGTRGSRERREFCLIGDRVNLAARLMQQGSILCDPETARRCADRVAFEALPSLQVKGKSQSVVPHRPLAVLPGQRPVFPLEGREAELAWVRQLRDRPRKLLLEGEPGLGKSRLAAEALPEALVLVADPHGIPGSIFRGQLELAEDLSAEALRASLLELTAGWAAGGRVVVVEDAHALDSVSRAVLEDSPGLALLLVARPGHGLKAEERLVLEPLGQDEVTRLACRRLGAQQLDSQLARWLRDRAEGNPFFTEEMLLALQAGGALEVEAGIVRLAHEPELLGWLDSVSGAITSRIDRLETAYQEALKAASVVGRAFALDVLGRVHPVGGLETILEQLERLELTPRSGPREYSFKHGLTREAAYNRLLYARRRELHRALAPLQTDPALLAHHWWEAGEPREALPHLVAAGERALRQGAYPEAARFLRRALEVETRPALHRLLAEACYGQGHLEECRRHLVLSLEGFGCRVPRSPSQLWRSPHWWQFRLLELPMRLPGPLGPWLADRLDRGAVRALSGSTARLCSKDPVAASPAMDAVLAWDRLTMLEAYAGQLGLSFHAGGETAARAEALGGPSSVLARSYAMTAAGCTTTLPLPRLAGLYRKHSLELARSFGDPALMARVLYCHAAVEMGQVRWAEAELLLKEARELSLEVRDPRQAAECEVIIADLWLCQGRLGQALEATERALAEGRERCDPQQEVYARTLRGVLLYLTGRDEEARATLLGARGLVQVTDRIAVTNWRGASALVNRDPAMARPVLRVLDRLPAPHWCRLGVLWATLAALGHPEARLGARFLRGRARFFPLCAAPALLCQGLVTGSESVLLQAIRCAEQMGMPLEAALAEQRLGWAERARARLEPLGFAELPPWSNGRSCGNS